MSRPYQIVQAVGLKEIAFSTRRPEHFTLTPKAGWMPLQRLCFWFLDKIQAWAYVEGIKYETYTIDAQTFAEHLWKQRRELLRVWNSEADYILIGRDDYSELMRTDAPRLEFSFHTPGGPWISGLRVRVVPWMKGMLVVPKERA